jgi:hypothetical protein
MSLTLFSTTMMESTIPPLISDLSVFFVEAILSVPIVSSLLLLDYLAPRLFCI